MVEVLSCQNGPCGHNYTWGYGNGVLALTGHSAQFGLMEMLKKSWEPQGLALLASIHSTLNEDAASQFQMDLPDKVWEFSAVPAGLLSILAKFSQKMLGHLLASWVRSTAALPEDGAEAFQQVTGRLDISLTDAQQLQRVPLLLMLAPNLTQLQVNCAGCHAIPTAWPSWPRAPQSQIRVLGLEFFHFQLATLPQNAFGNLTGLRELILTYNNLQTLPENIFQNLTRLKMLGLNSGGNPGLKRPVVCYKRPFLTCF